MLVLPVPKPVPVPSSISGGDRARGCEGALCRAPIAAESPPSAVDLVSPDSLSPCSCEALAAFRTGPFKRALGDQRGGNPCSTPCCCC